MLVPKLQIISVFLCGFLGIILGARADLPVLTKSIIVTQMRSDCKAEDEACIKTTTVMKNRSKMIRDAALASKAAYNKSSEVAKISRPIRFQADDNARTIMKGLGEKVRLFGGEVPAGLVSFNERPEGSSRPRIIVAFHGTESLADGWVDLYFLKENNKELLQSGSIHGGFNQDYMSKRDSMLVAVSNVLTEKKLQPHDVDFLLTGHSLGGALATLGAVDLKRLFGQNTKLYLVTFSMPRVVDSEGAQEIEELINKERILRIWRHLDPVPAVASGLLGFVHVGKSIRLDAKSYVPSMVNHKLDSILDNAFAQDNVEFVEDHVGVIKTAKAFLPEWNPLSWFSR